jgi:hypothetical protein
MFKQINFVFLLFFLNFNAYCDSELLQAYMQDFNDGEDTAKVNILRKAFLNNEINDTSGLLFEHALQYAFDNYTNAENFHNINNIIRVSLNGMRKTDSIKNLELLWNLFLEYPVSEVKADIIVALGGFGKKNNDIINKINNYLTDLNTLCASGESVDFIAVSSLISALMELDDISSCPVLLNVLFSGYPEVIYSEALGALDYIDNDLNKFLLDVIKEEPKEEKFAALKAGINSKRLSIAEQGQLAEAALELTIDDESDDLSILRYAAVSFLSSLRWTRANDLALRHYYSMLANFQENNSNKSRFIEAISFLGAVGNSEAALALGLQLGLINDRKEKTGSFDAGITLAIVQALGLIGDKAAFNHLLHTGKLSYNENIILAAREAIDRLKW